MDCNIRWMIRRDMSEVLEIENKSFREPLDEDDFLKYLRHRHCVGMVAESIPSDEEILIGDYQYNVLGFMIYQLYKERLDIIDFAVHPDYCRAGVGTELFNKLTSKLSSDRRTSLVFPVSEYCDDGLLFLKKMRCICEDFHRDDGEYTYIMKFRHEWVQV